MSQQGSVRIIPITAERDAMQEIPDWVNTTLEEAKMVTIDNLTITQRHLAVLTNPYLDNDAKFMGDEVNVLH
jgi:hypothetical protein